MGKMNQLGYEVVHEKEPAKNDIVIINTCGFIHDAKQESINAILELVEKKKNGFLKDVIVFGCLSERYKNELSEEIPEITQFYGVFSFNEIIRAINPSSAYPEGYFRKLTTPSHYAYLKISDGCDQRCSFCAIPAIKGKLKSSPVETLVEEANWLAGQGVREIILVSQDSSAYGLDLYGKRMISNLVSRLSQIEQLKWIRIHYLYPTTQLLDLIEMMATEEKICQYIDIPFQHISDKILKSMNRGFTAEKTYSLIQEIRKIVPHAALRTTLIVGYPGETQEDFDLLCDFVRNVEFDRLGVFEYSDEDGTAAFQMKNKIKKEVKQERASLLMNIQQEIAFRKNESLCNKTMKLIIDGKEGEFYIGRTEYDSPEIDGQVLIKSTQHLYTGNFYEVKITGNLYFDLMAEFSANA